MSNPKPAAKIRCECGRNLAYVYRAAHDRHHDTDQVDRIEPRPGVEWAQKPSWAYRPGGLPSAGWEATCPACGADVEVSARAVADVVGGVVVAKVNNR